MKIVGINFYQEDNFLVTTILHLQGGFSILREGGKRYEDCWNTHSSEA